MHIKATAIADRIAPVAEHMQGLAELADGMRTSCIGEQSAAAWSLVSDIVAGAARELKDLEGDLEMQAHASAEPPEEA